MSAIDDMIHDYVTKKSSMESKMTEELLTKFFSEINKRFGDDVRHEVMKYTCNTKLFSLDRADNVTKITLRINFPECDPILVTVDYFQTTFRLQHSPVIVYKSYDDFPLVVMHAKRAYEEIQSLRNLQSTAVEYNGKFYTRKK